jgi:hypothetical protein
MWRSRLKIVAVIIFYLIMPSGCNPHWREDRDCSQWPGIGFCPPGPTPPGKYGLAKDISRTWLGRPITELIKIWGEPQRISDCDRECIKGGGVPEYAGGDGKTYRWWYISKDKWETYKEEDHFLIIPISWERERPVTCVLNFRVDDKGKIVDEIGGQTDGCDQVIHQAMGERNWRAAPGTEDSVPGYRYYEKRM